MTLSYPDFSRLAFGCGMFMLAIILINTATFCIESVPAVARPPTPLFDALTWVAGGGSGGGREGWGWGRWVAVGLAVGVGMGVGGGLGLGFPSAPYLPTQTTCQKPSRLD